MESEEIFSIPEFKTKVSNGQQNHHENGVGDHRSSRRCNGNTDPVVKITKMRLNERGCTTRFFSDTGRCFEPTQLSNVPEYLKILAKLP